MASAANADPELPWDEDPILTPEGGDTGIELPTYRNVKLVMRGRCARTLTKMINVDDGEVMTVTKYFSRQRGASDEVPQRSHRALFRNNHGAGWPGRREKGTSDASRIRGRNGLRQTEHA